MGDDFEAHRPHLRGLAYRMLGSVAEAEDVVQDTYLRWHEVDRSLVDDPRAYLSRVAIRLSLDRLKSARARRERYVGPWLPEPVIEPDPLALDPLDLSTTLLLALERLSPLERAAFLLHDVFDVEFAEVARALDRSEAACRQLAARAREHVRESRPRFPVAREEGERIASAFLGAVRDGDVATLSRLLAEGAVLQTDGGGKRLAALAPIVGRDRIIRFFLGVRAKADPEGRFAWTSAAINGQPGFVAREPDGSLQTLAFDVRDGRIVAIFGVRNPDKLGHLAGPADRSGGERWA